MAQLLVVRRRDGFVQQMHVKKTAGTSFWCELKEGLSKQLHARWFWIFLLAAVTLGIALALLLPIRGTM